MLKEAPRKESLKVIKVLSLTIFFSLSLFISGCITTTFKSYVSPTNSNLKVNGLAILVNTEDIRISERAIKKIKRRFAYYDVDIYDFWEIVPITKKYNQKEINSFLLKSKVDAILFINLELEDSKSQLEGTYNTGNYSSYENTTYGNGFSISSYDVSRDSYGDAKLVTPINNNTIWLGKFYTESTGLKHSKIMKHVDSTIYLICDDIEKSGFIQGI